MSAGLEQRLEIARVQLVEQMKSKHVLLEGGESRFDVLTQCWLPVLSIVFDEDEDRCHSLILDVNGDWFVRFTNNSDSGKDFLINNFLLEYAWVIKDGGLQKIKNEELRILGDIDREGREIEKIVVRKEFRDRKNAYVETNKDVFFAGLISAMEQLIEKK